MKAIGLEPAGDDGTFRHSFPVPMKVEVEGKQPIVACVWHF